MYAYVINLARSQDRRAHMVAELKKTGMAHEFVQAVDGRYLDATDTTLVSLEEMSKISQFPVNSAASVLSHISCYERIVAEGRDAALILEDDAILPADIDALADSVAAQLTGAELALLNFNSRVPLQISREGSVPVHGGRMLALPIDAQKPASAAAYIITRAACERLIKFLPPIRMNADHFGFHYREGAIDRIRCVVPMPVRSSAKFNSTQGSYALGNGLKARLLWPVVRLELPVLHQVLIRRRQRIQDQWSQCEIVDVPFIEKPSRLD